VQYQKYSYIFADQSWVSIFLYERTRENAMNSRGHSSAHVLLQFKSISLFCILFISTWRTRYRNIFTIFGRAAGDLAIWAPWGRFPPSHSCFPSGQLCTQTDSWRQKLQWSETGHGISISFHIQLLIKSLHFAIQLQRWQWKLTNCWNRQAGC